MLPLAPILSSGNRSESPVRITRSASASLPSMDDDSQHVGSSQPNSTRGSLRRKATRSNFQRSYTSLDDNSAGRNENLLSSGQLGMCPSTNHFNGQHNVSRKSDVSEAKFYNVLYGYTKGWARRFYYFLCRFIPGVMTPDRKVVRIWNRFFVIYSLIAISVDPLFFFPLSVRQDDNCTELNWPLMITILVSRSLMDFVYFIHIIFQFRIAYVAPESRVMGVEDLVDDPKKIARNYLSGYFLLDVFDALPVPQIIIILSDWPYSMLTIGPNSAKNLLQVAFFVQYIPRLCRVLPFVVGLSPTGLIFESVWANFALNLLTFMLAGHVVGSCWYLFGLQRVNRCLLDACRASTLINCTKLIVCGHGNGYKEFQTGPVWLQWKNITTACFEGNSFSYGIYENAVGLTTEPNVATRYIYSLYWAFQQISSLAANQSPSYYPLEIIFTMCIRGVGLLLFALLFGNIQNFLQTLGRRRLEMSLRHRDVEQWMSHRDLPSDLRRQVRQVELYNWSARVNEEQLLESFPEDLRSEIRSHLLKFIKEIRIFQNLDGPVIDAICDRIRTKTYVKGSIILYRGRLIDKMVVIKRGKMESIGEDGVAVPLSEGEVCGEELLTWYLDHSSVNRDGRKLLSDRLVRCSADVEAFALRAADFEEVTSLFARFFTSPEAIRYISPYCQRAARIIQAAWRSRKNRLITRRNPVPRHQDSHQIEICTR